ncbi:hypothetical protein CO609_03230 [Lysobacteraceae bacterium NML91-0268]|nr:hypothetical protein CO609_03230 [Xanthomonadaceae bacterium NML91-0268]
MEAWLIFLVLAIFSVPVLLIVTLVWISGLRRRLIDVEQQLAELQAHWPPGEVSPEAVTEPRPQAEGSPIPADVWVDAITETDDAPPAVFAREAAAIGATVVPPPLEVVPAVPAATPIPTPPPLRSAPQAAAPVPGVAEKLLGGIKDWFTRGNLPVKVGMLVMLAGVVALLRYAGQQGWVQLSIELRLAGVAAAASAAVVFGWLQRVRRPQFALALQGGAIGALLLTIFAASKMYAVLPLGMAFAFSVALIAAAGVLAVLQDSRTLAILATLAGFCAPLWLSSGSGNHVALFTYYALLNLAIFGVVWLKPWRVLMLLGFVFTWGIGVLWGVLAYKPQFYASAQLFLALFFVLYLLMPLLHARKQVPGRGELINAALLFATPLIAFALQAGLMSGNRMQLAFVAVAVAAIYTVLGAWLRSRVRYRVLFDAYVLMAVGFVTLAIPLAFSAKVTGALLAVEGALLVWFGLRHQRALPLWSGIGLQLVAGFAHLLARARYERAWFVAEVAEQRLPVLVPVLNGLAISALLLALMGFASTWLLWRHRRQRLASAMYVWGLLCWVGLWLGEIFRFAPSYQWPEWILMLAAVTGWLAAEALRKTGGRMLMLALTSLLAMGAGLLWTWLDFSGGIWWDAFALGAWAIFAVLGWRSLVCLRSYAGALALWTQGIWWLIWPLALSVLADSFGKPIWLGSSWWLALLCLPWAAALWLNLRRPKFMQMPLGERFAPALPWLAWGYGLWLAVMVFGSLWKPGDVAPLPWLPIFNPLELMQLLILALLLDWQRRTAWSKALGQYRWGLLAALALLWVSQMVLRSTYHWGGLPWGMQMFRFSLAQTSLTVLWSVMGMAAWVAGSRRGHRGLWLMGALLMGLVLLKLLLVDRQHLGNLLGIGSFIAYGLLCTVVGYFAPAPPREPKEATA